MLSDREVREQIVQITDELFHAGHLTDTGGNISGTNTGGETIWITPSRLHKGSCAFEDLVHIRPDGSVIEGSRKPSIEFKMHFASDRARPGSTAFGICNQTFEPINTDAIALADTVTVPWFMPGSGELAEAVGEALKKSRGAILQNHGLMAVGDDLRKAATRAAMIEETAKLQLYIKQFGGTVSLLPDEWVKKLEPIKDFL